MALFEWDHNKNQKNRRKHGIDFDDARTVFRDPNRIDKRSDQTHHGEERFLSIGKLANLLIVVVVYTLRGTGRMTIRIISCFTAGKKHREEYISRKFQNQQQHETQNRNGRNRTSRRKKRR